MKNQFAYSCFFIIAILLSSCSQKSSIYFTKRHYRSGYYIETVSKKVNVGTRKIPGEPISYASQEKIISYTPHPEQLQFINDGYKKVQNEDILSENKDQFNKESTRNTYKHSSGILITLKSAKAVLKNSKNIKKVFSNIKNAKDDAGGEVLSLFWIVILVLLLLWLLGLLTNSFGIGGLINLLLLIALILLILWLLRIV